MLALANVTDATANTKAHLSPTSPTPTEANQPRNRGSVIVSASSCAVTLASAASPCECAVKLSCGSQPGSPSKLKTQATCTGWRLYLHAVCHAQAIEVQR